MFEHKINEKIFLRLLQLKDDTSLFKLIHKNYDYLSEWMPWVMYHTEFAHIKNFIENSLKSFANNEGMQCGIFFNDKLVGVIGFHWFNWTNESTSIGYWLDKNYQNSGIMTACVSSFVKYAFDELFLNRIEIRCAEYNTKSRAIPERLGFVNEGLLRQVEYLNGKFVNYVIYSILAQDFKIK